MSLHATLTGTDLHESKGVASASANTVAVATGGGTTTWQLIAPASLASSIKGVNQEFLTGDILDISTANSAYYVFVPFNCTVTSVGVVLNNAITVGNATVNFVNPGVGTMLSLSVPFSGSAAGTHGTTAITTNNAVAAGSYIQVISAGGSTTACRFYFVLTVTMT